MQFACLLIFHGSRDPRPLQATKSLARSLEAQFLALGHRCWVGIAALEGGEQSLAAEICQFHQQISPQFQPPIARPWLYLLPLFLLPGVHVMEDIPAQIALAQQQMDAMATVQLPTMRSARVRSASQSLTLLPYLGSTPQMPVMLSQRLAAVSAEAYILLAHGSRRSGGNAAIEQLAQTLERGKQITPAYWASSPDLADRVKDLINQGYRRIAILPYFLFAGRTTDAISQTVAQLAQTYPDVVLQLLPPLDRGDDLMQGVTQILQGQIANQAADRSEALG